MIATIFTIMVGVSIGLYINYKQSNWWRKILGVGLGFIISFVLGLLLNLGIALMIDESADIPFTLSNAAGRLFLIARFASIYGVYDGGRRIKNGSQ